jgi:hypothetical protein
MFGVGNLSRAVAIVIMITADNVPARLEGISFEDILIDHRVVGHKLKYVSSFIIIIYIMLDNTYCIHCMLPI